MSDWKKKYRQGTFRGVVFYTKSHEYKSGRRTVDHEFPNKNKGNAEDLGKKLPRYNLDLYVLGDDYFDQRDALSAVLEQDGPGELLHPYLGRKNVQVGEYGLSETVEEGRIARFKVEFITSGNKDFPAEDVDPFQSVLNAVAGVLGAASAALAVGLNVLNAPARVAQAAAALVSDAADQINAVVKQVGSTADAIADVGYAVRNIKADALDLVRAPSLLAARFQDAFTLLFAATTDFKALSKALSLGPSSFAPIPVVGSDTPTVVKLKGNQVAIANFIVESSIASQAQAAIQGNYISADESVDVRDLLNSVIEIQLPAINDDDTFQAVKDIQVAINRGLPPENVGELIEFVPPKTLPALVICNRLFGNIDKEDELISQNAVKHPGFVPAGVAVEVSSA